MRAISFALYFTPDYSSQVQKCCVSYLESLIKEDKLPPRLQMFNKNDTLFKQYSKNSSLLQFQKANLELLSLVFKAKVAIYQLTEDNYLIATVFNYKYEKTIELLKCEEGHFDCLFNKNFLQNADICRNLLQNVINGFLNPLSNEANKPRKVIKKIQFNADLSNDLSDQTQADTEGSLSESQTPAEIKDGDSKNHSLVISNSSSTHTPKDREPTSNKSVSFVEQSQEKAKSIQRRALPIPVIAEEREVLNSNGTFSSEGSQTKKRAFFDESVSTTELKILEKTKQANQQQQGEPFKSPIHFLNSPPPGLTPNRYQTKTYSNDESKVVIQAGTVINGGEKIGQPQQTYIQSFSSPIRESATMSPSVSLYKQRTIDKSQNLVMRSNDESPQNIQIVTTSGSLSAQKTLGTDNKRKPIVLDESAVRYTGKLKFFDETKNYGFIIMDEDGSDIFVHFDDLQKAGLEKELLKTAKLGNMIKLSFTYMKYIGKYDKSRKATDIQLID